MPPTNNQIAESQPNKAGWRVAEWAASAGISRSSVYELIADNRISSVRFGGARIITTSPEDFLKSLRGAA
jgi:excisionase family DNA binding protein